MNILDALKKPIFILPKFNNADSFPSLLEEIYKEFLSTVDNINEGTIVPQLKENRQLLGDFCATLVQSARTYFSGYPAKAYFEFEEGIALIDNFLFPPKGGALAIQEFEPYYRARIGSNVQYERSEMFHIPFEKREYVTTQRYSVPGLPSLYLSNSVYVCWEELRRPDINKLQVARFKLENYGVTFLDISLTPTHLIEMIEVISKITSPSEASTNSGGIDSYDLLTLIYIMKWPLIAACSIKVKKQDATFKPEYIFPQFLLQWVTHNKRISGIKYFSIEANISPKMNHSQLINYAIPVKEIHPTGLCKTLVKSFSLTESVSWEMLTIVNPEIAQHNHDKLSRVIQKLGMGTIIGFLELVKGKPMRYWHTIFGKIEIELAEMHFSKL